jgi:hypothetical protein
MVDSFVVAVNSSVVGANRPDYQRNESRVFRRKKCKDTCLTSARVARRISPVSMAMETLLGILPYIYFEEPVQLGNVLFLGIPDWQGRNHAPASEPDRESLRELSACFLTTRGLKTNKGALKTLTYFLFKNTGDSVAETIEEARNAITLLRYAMLRPDTQATDNIESTYVYAFSLPQAGNRENRIYQSWPNLNLEQEIWISPEHHKYPLPGWYLDLDMVHASQLEQLEELNQLFYRPKLIAEREDALLAMDWYNQSFLKYSISNIARRLVDISIAFETLFQLQKKNITMKKAVMEALEAGVDSPIADWAGAFYRRVRSATTHSGKPATLLYQHAEAQVPHLSFLWSAQRIFRECLAAKIGLPRNISNERLTEELTPNEIHLKKLREAGGFNKIVKNNLLGEIEKLRQIYPVGKREDIVWLGKVLLGAYKERYNPSQESLPSLAAILNSEDTGSDLGLKYYEFLKELQPIYPDGYISMSHGEITEQTTRKTKVITSANWEQFRLEGAIYHFARFAGYALIMPKGD